MSNTLFKKGLVSIAAAGLLTTASFAGNGTFEGTTADFGVTLDKTNATKTVDAVNVIVEILDEDGEVDVLSNDTLSLTVQSVLGLAADTGMDEGTSNTTQDEGDTGSFGYIVTGSEDSNKTTAIDFTKGKAGFTISYPEDAKIGQDTVRFSLKATDSDGDVENFGPLDKTIYVTNPSNQAVGLEIQAIETVSGKGDKSDYATDNNYSTTDGFVAAGESFTVKVQALKDGDNPATEEETTTFQNSTVTLKFLDVDDCDSATSSSTLYKSIEGSMVEGVAFIDIPEGFLTESDYFCMYATTPTTNYDSEYTADYVAKSDTNYTINITPSTPTALKATLQGELEQNSSSDAGDYAYIDLDLADSYGNIVSDSSSLETSLTAYIGIDSQIGELATVIDDSEETLATTAEDLELVFDSATSNYEINVTAANYDDLSLDAQGIGSTVLSLSSTDLEVLTPTINVPIYTQELNYNTTNATPTSVQSNASFVAGTLYRNFVTIEGITKSTKVKVEVLDDENSTVLASSQAYSSTDGNVSVRFTKALKEDEIGASRIVVDGKPTSDLTEILIKEINASIPQTVGLFKVTDYSQDINLDKITEVSEISLDLYKDTDDNITILTDTSILDDTSDTLINFSDTNNTYFLLLTDIYGNPIDSGDTESGQLIIESDTTNLTPYLQNDELSLESNDSTNIGYTKAGIDNIIVKSTIPGVDELTIPITITDTTPKLSEIQIVSGSDYLLTNGEIALTVNAIRNDASAFNISNNKLNVILSNPNLVTVRDSDRDSSGVYKNGAFLDCGTSSCSDNNDSIALSMIASNTVGDLTLTIKNTLGTVIATKDIKIVKSTADIVAVVDSISAVPESANLESDESVSVTFTVLDANSNPLANKSVSISSENTSIISVDTIKKTDENGEVTVELTGNKGGSVNITATSEGQSKVVAIEVTEPVTTMTLSVDSLSMAINEIQTVTATNAAGDLTISSSDEAIATAALDDNGAIEITALETGSATITVTDGTTTKTISVEVASETIELTIEAMGWNLLGNSAMRELTTSDFADEFYSYDGTWNQSTIAPAQGFWLNATETGTITLTQGSDDSSFTTADSDGWSLRGATEDATVSGEIVWTYDAVSQEWTNSEETTVTTGQGYWIKN